MNSILRYISRYDTLKSAHKGLIETGQYLVCLDKGNLFFYAETAPSDDLGIFYFIPLLAQMAKISIETAIDYFFYGMIGVSFCAFLIGFYLLFRSFYLLLYMTCIGALLYREGFFVFKGVYIANFAVVCLSVPLILWFQKRGKVDKLYSIFLFFLGIILGYFHYIRSFSSIPVIIFIFLVFIGAKFKNREKILLVCLLVMGISCSIIHMKVVTKKSIAFVEQQGGKPVTMTSYHSVWPSFYAGFGYIENHLDIKFDDGCVAQKVEELAPGTKHLSYEFCQVIKKEVLRILWEERYTAWSILFAKFGVALFLFLACMNLGFLASLYQFSWREQVPFLISCFISALPGIIAEPRPIYMTGLTAFSFVYGSYYVGLLFQSFKKVIKK